MTVRTMLGCRWAASRLHRYLDRDPALPLDAREVRRIEEHLRTCARCDQRADDFRGLSRLLGHFGLALSPDERTVGRLKARLLETTDGACT